jgi:hypothetical protein
MAIIGAYMARTTEYMAERVKNSYKVLAAGKNPITGDSYTRAEIAKALCRRFKFDRSTAYRHIKRIEQPA